MRKLDLRLFAIYLTLNVYKYDKNTDEFINMLLDRMTPVVEVSEYRVVFKLKDVYIGIWIANRWFGFATQADVMTRVDYPNNVKPSFYMKKSELYNNKRPKKRTQYRLARFIDAYTISPMVALNKALKSEINV